jgi:glycosyltransferase involved in cell wall biosynthesis
VACVIALNQNDIYVRRRLIPSLLGWTDHARLEIVVVLNGSRDPERIRRELDPIPVIDSEWGWVAKALNCGARATRAPILAFFHDDCVLQRGGWIEEAHSLLQGGFDVVAAEVEQVHRFGPVAFWPPLLIAKSVPVILRRSTLERLGGWDEGQYIGWEDLDLTLGIQAGGGRIIERDLGMLHEHGMSTILKYGHDSTSLRQAFALGFLPSRLIRKMQRSVLQAMYRDRVLRKLSFIQFARVLDRHAGLLKDSRISGIAECRLWLKEQIASERLEPAVASPAEAAQYDRAVAAARFL